MTNVLLESQSCGRSTGQEWSIGQFWCEIWISWVKITLVLKNDECPTTKSELWLVEWSTVVVRSFLTTNSNSAHAICPRTHLELTSIEVYCCVINVLNLVNFTRIQGSKRGWKHVRAMFSLLRAEILDSQDSKSV